MLNLPETPLSPREQSTPVATLHGIRDGSLMERRLCLVPLAHDDTLSKASTAQGMAVYHNHGTEQIHTGRGVLGTTSVEVLQQYLPLR